MAKKDNALLLIEHLLSLDGKHVATINPRRRAAKVRADPHVDLIWECGCLHNPETTIEVLPNAKPNRCHHLAARHYADQPNGLRDPIILFTGYALSTDIWRSHSWTALKSLTRIFEPTPEKRLRYFGVLLKAEEADKFVEANG